MKTVFYNELRLYFLSWLGWSALLLLNLTAFFGFNAGAAAYGKFEGLFSLLQMPLAWSVIIVGARTFARDKELGLYELFFTAPLPLWRIIAAKFAALLAFFGTALAGLLVYPLTASIFINISWMSVLSGMTALVLALVLFSALAVLASALSANTLTAIVSGFALWITLTLLGSLAGLLPTGSGLKTAVELLAYGPRFTQIASGVFRWDDLLYFFTLALVFLKAAESRVLAQISR